MPISIPSPAMGAIGAQTESVALTIVPQHQPQGCVEPMLSHQSLQAQMQTEAAECTEEQLP